MAVLETRFARSGAAGSDLAVYRLQRAVWRSVLAEQVFSYPGLGQATVEAGLRGDVPLLLGIVLFSAVLVFTGNTVADLIYRAIDPRIREGRSV